MPTTRRWLIPLAVAATIAFNSVAQRLPLNGRTTGEISDSFQVYVTPAGYVFAIWGLIYVGLIAFSIYQWRIRPPDRRLDAILVPFLVSCAANIGWLALWHYGYVGASLAAMLLLLGSLGVIYTHLRAGPPRSPAERWCVDHPFSVYVGWVTLATLVNLSVVLEAYDARPFGLDAPGWAVVMLGTALLIAAIAARRFGDRWYLVVYIWAGVGIAVAEGQNRAVAGAALLLTVAVAVLATLAPRLAQAPSSPPPHELRSVPRR